MDVYDVVELQKIDGAPSDEEVAVIPWYAAIASMKVVSGDQSPKHEKCSTKPVERQNLTMRMGMRRFNLPQKSVFQKGEIIYVQWLPFIYALQFRAHP